MLSLHNLPSTIDLTTIGYVNNGNPTIHASECNDVLVESDRCSPARMTERLSDDLTCRRIRGSDEASGN